MYQFIVFIAFTKLFGFWESVRKRKGFGIWLRKSVLVLGYVHFRYTMDRPRFSDHLEAIKFICKDFWSELFKKQIDNLKTNHRVIFFLFLGLKSEFLVYEVFLTKI